ncbi:MAG: hypothetical protein Q9190_002705 [Brigantiaea leucoxantha]
MASDDDFFVLRRFGKLGARVVLRLQNEIAQLEDDLQAEDAFCMRQENPKLDNGTFALDPSERRKKIMEELTWRMERYQRFVLDHSNLKARAGASSRQIKNINTWLTNNVEPIHEREVKFLEKEGDLIPLVPRAKPPLRRFLDLFPPGWICCERKKLNQSHFNHPDNFESNTTVYAIESRIDKIVTAITISLGLGMLIGPLWLLQHVSAVQPNTRQRLIVITAFLIGFTIMMGIVTTARPFEVLAATAAYGAVLMVFMQLQGPYHG